MRRFAIATISVLALFLAVAAPSGARANRKARPTCHVPAGARHRAADEAIEVYETNAYEVFGCEYGQRRMYRLTVEDECRSSFCGILVSELTVSGSYVAYGYFPYSKGAVIAVRNLRTGHLVHEVSLTNYPADIVLKPDGSVAWIAGTATEGFQVDALDQSGRRVLATIGKHESKSLALAGSTLYWTQEGKPASAVLN